MRYFGPKSLSSVLYRVTQVAWILMIPAVLALCTLLFFAIFQIDLGDPVTSGLNSECAKMTHDPDWQEMMSMPTPARALVFPYLFLLAFLMVQILRKSQSLFDHFRNNDVFRTANVRILSNLNKYMIGLAVVTFNPATLLVCLILLLVTEILKDGSVLQDELDLTV
ncbi:MAG: hypothetical protein IPN71_04610 [Fibrobacteres bacterium]|nr:hypothetical protein [Fibrobacterota bacterium]